ncbi:MAG: hypothetical protein AAFX76_01730 [Planctomycetota bacterium]
MPFHPASTYRHAAARRTALGVAAAGLAFVAAPSPGVAQVVAFNGASPQTVVVTQRPLRTLDGQAVRVGRFSSTNDQTSIGVVRARREQPFFANNNKRGLFSDVNRSTRSDRWYQRELALGRIAAPVGVTPAFGQQDLSIGVVRAFRTFDPVERIPPQTFTNPNAADRPGANTVDGPPTVGPAFPNAPAAGDASVYAVTQVELPDGQKDNPWALLNQGFYRESANLFFERDTPEARTGAALAAALSGDLAGAAARMPADPAVPAGVTFRPATRQRIAQTQQFLYADDPQMQQALRFVLDATAADAAK